MREKVGKSRNTVFFQWFVAPEGWKVGSLKRRVRSQLARREMKNCTPLWRGAHFQVKMYKTHHGRTTFGSWDVEKVHAIVARSTFPSQNVQNTSASHHFWKLRRRKSARRCGANHISKSKCTKHTRSGPLLAVEMSKNCTLLWREAHFEVNMYEAHHVRTLLEVQMPFRVAGARDCVMRIFEPQTEVRTKGFFYPFALDLDIFSLSSPDFSLILDILCLTFFKIIFLIIVFIIFYPPSCKMDQNWLPQAQKAKGWGKV